MVALHNPPQKALQLEENLIAKFSDPAISHELAFWTTDQCLVVPGSLKKHPEFSAACAQLSRSGWPVVLRKTGGGVTPQGQGILNIAMAYAPDPIEEPTINGVYDMFCTPLIKLFEQVGCTANTGAVKNCFCDGAFNIVVGDKKVVGTAQRWTRVKSTYPRQVIFAHALMLLDADIPANIAAVNELYQACGIDTDIRVEAHENLQTIASSHGKYVDQSHVIQSLTNLYRDELIALTE